MAIVVPMISMKWLCNHGFVVEVVGAVDDGSVVVGEVVDGSVVVGEVVNGSVVGRLVGDEKK